MGVLAAAAVVAILPTLLDGQTFSSGSTGVDGALHLALSGRMLSRRSEHTATRLPDGRVLIAGGHDGSRVLSTAEIFDPATRRFTTTGTMTSPRYAHTATLLNTGKVLIAGGHNGGGYFNGVEIYDPVTGQFQTTASMAGSRGYHGATLLVDGRVLISGGDGNDRGGAEIYRPDTGDFAPRLAMVTPHQSHTATRLNSGHVLLAGGWNGGASRPAELFDPSTGLFVSTSPLNTARYSHTATLLADDRVLIAGGYSNGYLSSAEIYDPHAGFLATASMTSARSSHSATLLSSGRVLLVGGYNGSSIVDSSDVYDPSAGVFVAGPTLNATRYSHAATTLDSGAVLITGGISNQGRMDSTDFYDPTSGLMSTVLFDPKSFSPALDANGDGVYEFTSIFIGPNTRVKLAQSGVGARPVHWLASGAVQIEGPIDLAGEAGAPVQANCANRRLAVPGPGGYPGGMGASKLSFGGGAGVSPAQSGAGPGGGGTTNVAGFRSGAGGGHAATGGATDSPQQNAGASYGNPFLVPLQGGSGGGGGAIDPSDSDICAGGGGAGGGALLIASSVSIAVDGTITADGGAGGAGTPNGHRVGVGGGGSGGSVHLIAPLISGTGSVTARGGSAVAVASGVVGSGSPGRVRVETRQNSFTGTINPTPVTGSPSDVPRPTNAPTVRVTHIGPEVVPPNPSGSFEIADVTVHASTLTLRIEARHIPLNAVVKIYITSENGPDQVVDAAALQGTPGLSTTSAEVTFPRGFSRGYARVTWR